MAKEIIDKMKRQPTELEKIFANAMTHQNQTIQLKKYARDLNRHFSKEGI